MLFFVDDAADDYEVYHFIYLHLSFSLSKMNL